MLWTEVRAGFGGSGTLADSAKGSGLEYNEEAFREPEPGGHKLSTSNPWRRILAESVAVIASILIAFAIDAAWDGHLEKRELRELLQGLRREMLANQDLVEEAQVSTQQATERLKRFRSGPEEELVQITPADSYDEFYLPFVRGWDAPLQTGFLEATISSGKLAMIPDPITRASLTSLAADIAGLGRLLTELDRMGADAAAVMGEYPGVRQVQEGVEIDPGQVQGLREDARL